MNGGQTDAPEMAGKHQKMYFSFFKIALFVLPIIIRVNTKERVIFLPYGEKISDYVQIERLHKEFYLNVQYIIT